MRLLPVVTLTAASFAVLSGPAAAATLTAVVQNAPTSDPTAWSPPMLPRDGDTLVVPHGLPITVDTDLRLDHLEGDGAIVRLGSGIRLALAGPGALRDLTVSGTPTSELTFAGATGFTGTLRLLGGMTATSVGDLTFAPGAKIQTGGGPAGLGAVFALQRGTTRLQGPITQTAPANTLRPIFEVGRLAELEVDGTTTQDPGFHTIVHGKLLVEGGAELGRLDADGTIEVRRGETSRKADIGTAHLNDARVRFVQGPDGVFPSLTGPDDITASSSEFVPVLDPTADQAGAPEEQQLLGEVAGFSGQLSTFGTARIDAASTWVASWRGDGKAFVRRHTLTRDPQRPAHISPAGAQPVGTVLSCVKGAYSTLVDQTAIAFRRDGVEVAANGTYTLTEADRGHELTCTTTVVGEHGNRLDEVPAAGTVTVAAPEVEEPGTPETPETPATPSAPKPDSGTPAAETPAATTPAATAPATVAPASAAAATAPAPAKPAAPTAPAHVIRTLAALPTITTPATAPATCPTDATLDAVTSAWRSADGRRVQDTLTGGATPGVWRCRVAGTQDGEPVVLRSLPVLVANGQRAMFSRETVKAARLSDPTLLSSGAQRISARLYARKADSRLGTRTTRFTQAVRRGENTVAFTKHVGTQLPKGRYKLVVRALTPDGVSAPLIQELTIG